jgi:hypothetical protein
MFFAALCLMTMPAHAAPDDATTLSSQQLNLRLDTLGKELDDQQTDAEYWEYGWGAFDASTMIWSAVQAAGDDNRKDRNTDIVQAGESLIGLADVIFRPLPAFSASYVCRDPALSRQDMLHCLEVREAMLKASAERAHEPYEMLPHLGNFGFNLVAGLIVWKTADTRHALITAIPGEIVGEAQIWSTPGQPMKDYDKYQLQFGPLLPGSQQTDIPASGLMVSLRF